jgi:hypothetical protein
MIKLIDLLKEGTISLTQDERDQIERLIPDIIKIIKGPKIKSDQYEKVDWINFEYADKTPGKAFIWVGNDYPKASAYFNTNDRNNPTDNSIVVQQHAYSSDFGSAYAMYNNLVGDKNIGIERLRAVLKHELIHAKDPATNHHYLKEPYDPNSEELYYKSWAEFQTMTGQFFEAITTGVDRILISDPSKVASINKWKESIKKIDTSLNDILNFYSGKSKSMSQSTADFIQDTGQRNSFQSLLTFAKNLLKNIARPMIGTIPTDALDLYNFFINKIKTYNPEGYKEFLKDLYKTIDQAKDKVNTALDTARKNPNLNSSDIPSNINLTENKNTTNKEFLKMQKIAGIIK